MSMPVLLDQRWSPEDVERLPSDGNRYECIGGALLVTPAPDVVHQELVVRLVTVLGACVADSARMGVLLSPADIRLETGTTVQPDVFVYYRPQGGLAGSWKRITALAVAVEVLSPGSVRHDRVTKREFYQRMGVDEYWIVDPDSRTVERWRPTDQVPEVCTATLTWRGLRPDEPLEIDLVALFAKAFGER